MAQSSHSTSLLEINSLQDMPPARIAIVHTEWNDKIVRELMNGCEGILHRLNGSIIRSVAVPGSVEIPFGCRRVWEHYADKAEQPEAIIAFGAVIRGGTPHFEYVCDSVTEGILQLNLTLPIPVIFGVLTLDTIEQAWERLGGSHGHKGEEAAITALKMIQMSRSLK